MDKKLKEVREKLKNVVTIQEFTDILDSVMLSEEERQILWKHYKEQKPLGYIADELGLAEVTVRKRHRKLLNKIMKLLS